ncbi:MAG: hypothetical protein KDD40_07345 [Bdellovibrionales bacterium]|nr:hypothetical protein [Bdellovibrionales bacterium]
MRAKKHTQPLHELPLELRAYINQQVSTLAPFCLPDSRAAVEVLKEIDENDNENFIVSIILTGEGTQVKSTSSADNIVDATKNACQTLFDHLNRIHREMLEEMEEKDRKFKPLEENPAAEDRDEDDSDDSNSGGKAVCH